MRIILILNYKMNVNYKKKYQIVLNIHKHYLYHVLNVLLDIILKNHNV